MVMFISFGGAGIANCDSQRICYFNVYENNKRPQVSKAIALSLEQCHLPLFGHPG
jgi:hypothetical protein